MTTPRRVSCGLDFCSVPDIRISLQGASESGYDFTCLPIVHPRFKREFLQGKCKNRPGPFTRSDLILGSSDWNNLIVGKLSPYINVDCQDATLRKHSEEMLGQELAYASHLGLPAIMFTLRGPHNTNLARIIHNKMQAGCIYQVWISLPMESPLLIAHEHRANEQDLTEEESNTWYWWNNFRSICNFENKLGLALEMSADIPSSKEIERWMGEPIKAIILPTTVFISNKRGFPVLSKPHQNLVKSFASLNCQIVIRGAIRHTASKYYQQYLDHICHSSNQDPLQAHAKGYEDYLQCPLQPLMDNLESQTYEVFEKDPVKYNEYQNAIYNALVDMVPFEEKNTKEIIIMVVGAGRGPLIRASLNASTKADRKIKIYAVEKNPNAVVSLQAQQEELWGDTVTVVSCDMREWNPPEKADILVSELLGSFGDNELSPECLDGAQKFLKKSGVSIPSQYTSYLCPVQSSKLYNEVRMCKDKDKHPLHHYETPYVVHLQNRFQLASPQRLFQFNHPNPDPIPDNRRYEKLTFHINQDCVLHGFSGYFDTVLYKDVQLSIVPETHSQGMFSWFPIFSP